MIIGSEKTEEGLIAANRLGKLYEKWIPSEKIITINTFSSELVKLASNAMLAQRISSVNSLSILCQKTVNFEINFLFKFLILFINFFFFII